MTSQLSTRATTFEKILPMEETMNYRTIITCSLASFTQAVKPCRAPYIAGTLPQHTLKHWSHVNPSSLMNESTIVKISSPLIVVSNSRQNKNSLTRFNKIAIPNNKFQMVKWTRKPLAYRESNNFLSMCSPPLSNICQFYFKTYSHY